MNRRYSGHKALKICAICLFLTFYTEVEERNEANAQTARAPVIYSTPPKLIAGKLKNGESKPASIVGSASFTLTEANDDDTMTGTFVYQLPDEGRVKISELTRRDLKTIAPTLIKKDLTARFRKGTACPIAHLELAPLEFEVAGAKLIFQKITLEFVETPDRAPQLLCTWARQINANRQRQGVIAAINRLIAGENPP